MKWKNKKFLCCIEKHKCHKWLIYGGILPTNSLTILVTYKFNSFVNFWGNNLLNLIKSYSFVRFECLQFKLWINVTVLVSIRIFQNKKALMDIFVTIRICSFYCHLKSSQLLSPENPWKLWTLKNWFSQKQTQTSWYRARTFIITKFWIFSYLSNKVN